MTLRSRTRLRLQVGVLVRDTRTAIGWTQDELGTRAGCSRSQVARVEAGSVNVSLDMIARLADGLGLDVNFVGRPPFVASGRQRDAAHARLIGYVQRRFHSAGWKTAREVEVGGPKSHGFIDLLAYDEKSGILLVVEVKTEVDDLGRIERTLAWYEREAWSAARRLGWQPRLASSWLLALATDAVESRLVANHEFLQLGFPVRAPFMAAALTGRAVPSGRGIALVDPRSRRRVWLLKSRIDGRRGSAPYRDYADFMSTLVNGKGPAAPCQAVTRRR